MKSPLRPQRARNRRSPKLASTRKQILRPRVPWRLPRLRRKETSGVFVLIVVGGIALIAVTSFSVYLHDELIPAAVGKLVSHTLWYITAVAERPLLLLTLLLLLIFLWSFPWESFFDGASDAPPSRDRGRFVRSEQQAKKLAAARQAKRREKRPR